MAYDCVGLIPAFFSTPFIHSLSLSPTYLDLHYFLYSFVTLNHFLTLSVFYQVIFFIYFKI